MLNGAGLNSPFLMSPKPLPPGDASTSCSAASASINASVMRTILLEVELPAFMMLRLLLLQLGQTLPLWVCALLLAGAFFLFLSVRVCRSCFAREHKATAFLAHCHSQQRLADSWGLKSAPC